MCRRPHLVGSIWGFKISKSRGGEGKLRQKRADRRKKKKLGDMKTPPPSWWGVFLANFNNKIGES